MSSKFLKMHKVSAVVITKNEKSAIGRALDSVLWCDEIIVIDDFSTDSTVNIAKKHGAKVYRRKLNNDFAAQRNYGISKTNNDWVLFIDADEVISKELKNNIQKVLSKPKYMAYGFVRVNIFLGKEILFTEPNNKNLVRLVNKNNGIWERKVHEYWDTDQEAGAIEGKLLHYNTEDINDLINKIAYYSEIHASEILKERKKVNIFKPLFYPPAKFIKNYVFEKGYKDGIRGFILSMTMSFHSFLSWSKLCLEK